MLRFLSPLALGAMLFAAACSQSDPKAATDKGTAALASGDNAGALEHLDTALSGMAATDPNYMRASMARCQALARTDPPKAKSEFLALCQAQSSRVKEQDFSTIVSELVKKDALTEAADVMDAGVRMFPESPLMMQAKALVIDASKKSKSSGAMDKLKGLGYVGNDDP